MQYSTVQCVGVLGVGVDGIADTLHNELQAGPVSRGAAASSSSGDYKLHTRAMAVGNWLDIFTTKPEASQLCRRRGCKSYFVSSVLRLAVY